MERKRGAEATPKLQEHLRKNIFGSRNNNNSDRANEEVKETQKRTISTMGTGEHRVFEPWGHLLGPMVN
jgi:hypothetical protein